MTQQIAILGLGTMGMGMAKNLMKAGFSVSAYNRTSAKAAPLGALGAHIANTPADAARDADVVISMLSDDDVSRKTWTGKAWRAQRRKARRSAGGIQYSHSRMDCG